MSVTSYAPQFEDLLLWRALRQVADGRYLDVGAGDPLAGSVTQLFYERGWRGINLEPAHGHLRQLRIARPADRNL
ncbi:FkbM family methyltransferase, partial [Duganella callida]